MSAEFDPIFVRALYLLHSRHPKSLEQLCALRDEALGKKPESSLENKKEEITDLVQVEASNVKQPAIVAPESSTAEQGDVKDIVKGPSDISITTVVEDEQDDVTETVEVECSSLSAKGKGFEDDELIETVEELSSSFCETLEELSSSGLLPSKKKRPKLLELGGTKPGVEDLDLASRESSPDHEMSTDLEIHCILCSSGKTSIPGNQLVECHECHEHYHQNCHKPNITDQNINDPRHVWYCSSCVKRMKEATTTTTTTKPKQLNPSGLSFKSPTQSFKPPMRMDGKPPSFSPGPSSVNQSFSIPSLTGANTSSTSGGLKSSSSAYPRDVTRNSLKRLQLVKKKAAAKNQQRFTKR